MLELVQGTFESGSSSSGFLLPSFDVVDIVEVDDGDGGGGPCSCVVVVEVERGWAELW